MRAGWGVVTLLAITPSASAKPRPAHLDAWTTAWRDARACLVGDPQLAADPGVAFSLRELRSGKHVCEAALQRAIEIARASADDDAGYHVAWLAVFDALTALDGWGLADTKPQGIFVGNPRDSGEEVIDRALPPVDAADAALRRRAGAPIAAQAAAPTKVGDLDLGNPIAGAPEGNIRLVVARDRALVFDGERRDGGSGRFVVRDPDHVEFDDTQDWVHAGGLAAGRDLTVLRQFAHDTTRVVVAGTEWNGGRMWLVTSTDGGAHWSKRAPLADGKLARVPVASDANITIVWDGPNGSKYWQLVAGATPGPRHVFHGDLHEVACAFEDRLWWVDIDGALHASDATGDHDLGTGRIDTCTPTHVLVRGSATGSRACDAERCGAPTRFGYSENVASWLDDAGAIASARQVSRVFEVTAGGRTRTFTVTGSGAHQLVLVAGASWGGATYLAIAQRWAGLHLVKVPE